MMHDDERRWAMFDNVDSAIPINSTKYVRSGDTSPTIQKKLHEIHTHTHITTSIYHATARLLSHHHSTTGLIKLQAAHSTHAAQNHILIKNSEITLDHQFFYLHIF